MAGSSRNMTSILMALLIGSAGPAFAQDQLRETALQMQAGQQFAEKLIQNALPIGKTGDFQLALKEGKNWECLVRIKNGAGYGTTVTADAESPERACVKAVLALNKEKAL
ncbi:hypothetical protein [Paraburkholderia fungorum]|nr:hypothetical protein [Paraburkholderia fungorum]MBB4517266.1 hypothetical protein [Paraburkholderia fungorum]